MPFFSFFFFQISYALDVLTAWHPTDNKNNRETPAMSTGLPLRVPYAGYPSSAAASAAPCDVAGSAPGLTEHLFRTSTLGHRAVLNAAAAAAARKPPPDAPAPDAPAPDAPAPSTLHTSGLLQLTKRNSARDLRQSPVTTGAGTAGGAPRAVSPECMPLSPEQLALQRLLCAPATPKHLSFFASVVADVVAANSKHLFALQLSSHRAATAAATAAAAPGTSTGASRAAFLQQTAFAQQQALEQEQRARRQITAYDGMAAPSYPFERYLQRIARYTAPAPIYYVIAFIYMDRIAVTPRSAFARRYGQATRSALYHMAHHSDAGATAETPPPTPTSSSSSSSSTPRGASEWWEDRLYLSELNLHRLFLSCIVVAIKFWSDNFYDNAVYGRVGGVAADEMLSLELSTLLWLDFRLLIDDNDFVCHHSTADLPTATELLSRTGSSPLAARTWLEPAAMLPTLLVPTLLNKLSLVVDNDEVDFDAALASPRTATPSPQPATDTTCLDPLACSTRERLTFHRLIELLATPGMF